MRPTPGARRWGLRRGAVRFCLGLLVLGLPLAPQTGTAHEVRPGYLKLEETVAGQFMVTWKQPVLDGRRLPLEPQLPADCTELDRLPPERTPDALIERWTVACDLREGTITLLGLSRTLTDALLSIHYGNGDEQQLLLRPDAPAFDLESDSSGVASYLVLGIEHLLFGIDHVLFVVLLVFYVQGAWPLLKTVTAFTVAHSLTLSAAALDWVRLPQGPVEAMIALSILYLARELMLPRERRSLLTQQSPWLMAFAFGLLHGFGFAGALKDIGLPGDLLWLALLLFNVGVELGQLALIAVLLSGAWLAQRLLQGLPASTDLWRQRLNGSALLGAGCIAGYWTIDRCLPLLT
ncbi:MAG: HupE/UreJ family protein [Pseudomonadota bacterium]